MLWTRVTSTESPPSRLPNALLAGFHIQCHSLRNIPSEQGTVQAFRLFRGCSNWISEGEGGAYKTHQPVAYASTVVLILYDLMYLWSQVLHGYGNMQATQTASLPKNTWTALPSNTPNNFPANPLVSHLWQSNGRCICQGQQYSAVRDFVRTSNLPELLTYYVCLKETDHITDWGKPTINPPNWHFCISAPP